MEALPHIPRSRPGPRLPHRRSKAQRDRQRGPSPTNSLSSSPEPAVWPRPQRKKKRRKRGDESAILREEDLIDGFCISSYGSLEAMQRDVSMDSVPLEEPYKKRPPGKRKRSDGGSSEDPGASENQHDERAHRGQKRHCPEVGSITVCTRGSGPEHDTNLDCLRCCLDAGYICDAESSSEEQVPSDDLAVSFTISTSTASPPLSGGRLKLTVLSQISGLGRSCEKSQEPEMEYIPPPQPPTPVAPLQDPPRASPKVEPVPVHPTPPPPPSVEPGASRSSVPKPLPAAPPAAALSQRSTTPSISLPIHAAPSALPSVLRPPSHHHMNLFAPTQALPPPPPLLQVPGHPPSAVLSEHNIIGQEMGSRFLAAPPGSAAEIGAAVRPMYQFHQHNHQHTHQHTHQHFTPYPHNFEKYPGKIESLYRQNPNSFFPPFSPVITALPPVLPPSVSFGSLQGAFQPKSTSSELASRCSVPPPMPHKAPQMTEQFKSRRSGRWCAMHVRVAYMILRHQERIKLAHGNPHKPELRSDLLCLNAGISPLPSAHDLAPPSSLVTAAVSHTPPQFQVAPSAATFLSQAGPSDPFLRAPGLSALASLTNGAFGGLGNPSYNSSTIFNHKEAPTAHSFPSPHDHWNRLHRTPPTFPAPPPQVCGKVGDMDPHIVHIKDEKERDLIYSRLAPRVSPLTQRLPGSEERSSSRTLSPYITMRPGSSSDIKPRLTPDHPSKVKVKEEPELLTFEVGRSPLPGLHLPHPSPPFERLRGAFLGEQYPNALEAWRDVYRRADPPPLRLPPAPPQRLYEQREERAHILREDFERARIYGLPSHVTMQPTAPSMLGALYHHHHHPGTGLLSKTPPINLLSAPPPLISTSRPGSPPRRDLYKDRDCR